MIHLRQFNLLKTIILITTMMTTGCSSLYNLQQPPPPGPIKNVSFPSYFATTLENGIRVLIIEHHEQPIVSLRLLVKSGSTFDSLVDVGDLQGLASITGELLTKGTTSRSATQIAEEIDFVGGQLSSGSDWDASYVTVSMLKKHLDVGFNLLSDVVLHPTFPQEEIERVRQQRLTAIVQRKDDPGFLAESKFSEAVYNHHPYGKQLTGTEKSVKAITREHLVHFHQSFYLPNNTLLAVVGDITPSEVMPKIESLFGSWQKRPLPETTIPPIHDVKETRVYIVDKPGAVQSAIRIGHVGIARKTDDFIPLYVLNTLLGGYFNSRINLNLRERHGYTYGARTSFEVRKFPGPFIVSADVRNAVTDSAIAQMLYELNRIQTEKASQEELMMVKSYITGSFPLQIETPNQIASKVLDLELYELPKDFYNTFNEKISTVTTEDLLSMAQQYLHPIKIAIVVSGNSKEIKSTLEKFGPVEVYNADGQKLSNR